MIRILEPPGLPAKGDLADLVAMRAGKSPEAIRTEIEALAASAPVWQPPTGPATEQAKPTGKPAVILPHGAQSISEAGRALGELLASTQRFFVRGGAVAKLAHDPDGLPRLDEVKAATLASDFEAVALLCKTGGNGPEPATCPEQTAKIIAASAAFRDAMPPISVLTRCPVQIERAGGLMQISGYDRATGIFAAGKPAEPMDATQARILLRNILEGFRFATPADRARALAAIVTPALVFGGLLRGRAPVDLGEADASQTGKGYRNKLTAALYSQSVRTITQQKSGVGSLEESFNAALIRGANFIALDNIRGRIDSPAFESFLTEETYSARMPYREPVEIDPRRVVIMLTSNKADVTTDLANRSSCVRILKQPDGHIFTAYPEGDILEHVRANQPRYLGAVFAIVKAWYDAGRPRTTETRHDFRPWAQTLDWITRNLLDAGPLLDGHRETQARMTNPVLNWLRDVALEVTRAKQAGAWLRAGDLVDLIAETGIETPGLPEHGDLTDHETRKAAQQATGRKLGLCFRAGDQVTIDGMTIDRRETYEPEARKHLREYRFLSAPNEPERIGANPTETPDAAPDTPAEETTEQAEMALCAYGAPDGAPNDAPIKTLIAPNAPDTTRYGQSFFKSVESEGVNIHSMEPLGALGATEAEINHAFDLAAVEIEEGEIQ
jgi:hypothetical protein